MRREHGPCVHAGAFVMAPFRELQPSLYTEVHEKSPRVTPMLWLRCVARSVRCACAQRSLFGKPAKREHVEDVTLSQHVTCQ